MPAAHRRVRITLPRLSGSEALLVVEVLERVVHAVWRAYGDDMADTIGRDHPAPETLCHPDDEPYVLNAADLADNDIPF